MIFDLNYSTKLSTVGQFTLDVLLSEKVKLGGKFTRYPIEEGSEISDHKFKESEELVISGSIGMSAGYEWSGAGVIRQTRLLDVLRDLHAQKELVTVTTNLAQYTEMGVESVNWERGSSGDGGNGFVDVTINLVKVTKVSLRTADIPPEKVKAPTKGRAGKTATKAGQNNNNAASTSDSPKVMESAISKANDKGIPSFGISPFNANPTALWGNLK